MSENEVREVIFINFETNEITQRPETEEEKLKTLSELEAAELLERQKAEEKAAQLAPILERLGITEEEAKLLLS